MARDRRAGQRDRAQRRAGPDNGKQHGRRRGRSRDTPPSLDQMF